MGIGVVDCCLCSVVNGVIVMEAGVFVVECTTVVCWVFGWGVAARVLATTASAGSVVAGVVVVVVVVVGKVIGSTVMGVARFSTVTGSV